MTFLVELALAECHSKNAGVSIFFSLLVGTNWEAMLPGVPSGDRGNWGKEYVATFIFCK